MHSMGKTLAELHAMLKLHEKGIPKKAKTPTMLAIREGRIQKDKKKPQGAKGKDKGKNKLAYAPKPKIPSPPKRDNPAKDSIYHHYKEGLRESMKLKHGALSLYMGNGMRATIEAIRSFGLILPSSLIIILDNCHFAPTVTRGVVSISCLVNNSYIHTFTNYGISVSKDNVFYFNAILCDDIYEIDMHNLFPNVSSMYNVSNKRVKHALDSYYLWHCRLDHINKKHIDMLQHDGLLKPTHDESYEKCKSCISGKMERKPFPHPVERAKDLLGLIHTDVCGPFRTVSREGANYFITFSNDFSRYGFVYLMKHKHEVLTTLPKSFWGYALETAARILNMVPTKKVERTPYEIWHGKAPNFMLQEASRRHELLEMSRSDKGLALIQKEDTQPSKNTSESHNEVAPIEVEPHNVGVPIRRSERIPQVPDRYGYYVDIEEHELGDINEPTNYKAALADTESDKWLEAMNMEMQSMKDNQVWYLVDLPSNGRTVGCKWLFKKKTDIDGNVYTFKARLVAKGFTQTYGVDYGETFSPVANIRAIRILLAIDVFYYYEIWQMNVKIAFLNGHLSEDVYMVQPEGFVDPKHPNKVCKLQLSIYGLKQSSRSWNKSGSNVAFLVLYVDDILLMGNRVTMLQEFKSWLCKCFSMKDLGEAAYILGIKIIRDRSKQLIALSQSTYLEKILKKFRMENSKKGYTPMMEKPDYRKSQGAKTPTKVQHMRRVPNASAIGSIMYAMRKFIDGLGSVMPSNKRPMEMLCDNEPALAIASAPEILKGAIHIQRKCYYIREVIQEREIVLKKVHTHDNVADLFTKPLPLNKHYKRDIEIGIVPASSLM
ncbi:retrotransposon protein, putative, ty1-copia subclass [Tanacetum coccineum]